MKENLHKGHRSRVKDRYLNYGLENFDDHQILEMLLFYAYPQKDTNEIAHKMLNEFGSLHLLFDSRPDDICKRCNVTMSVAILVSSIVPIHHAYVSSKIAPKTQFDTTQMVGEYCIDLFAGCTVETFYVICLNKHNQILKIKKLFEGTLENVDIYPRKIIETVITFKAVHVILCHNHPGGVASPSKDDDIATKLIIDALQKVDVYVIDHIIVGGNKYYSFSENGMMFFKKYY